MPFRTKQVAVALSGGVDSAVAAARLVQAGWQVLGVHLLLSTAAPPGENLTALGYFLGIPVRTVDMREEFQLQVIDYFRRAYQAGTTPNPCVRCNEQIKFGRLLQLVQSWGYPFLATGHYARIAPVDGRLALWRGVDPGKEQSYFLHRLRPEALASILFPLGEWTKAQVRAQAEALGLLPYIQPRESQELCFIAGKYRDYVKSQAQGGGNRPGPIVDRTGKVLGTHRGLEYYTVGQRQGLGIAAPAPYYVLELRPAANTLVVGAKADLLADVVQVAAINWLAPTPAEPWQAAVRLRYRHAGVGCRIYPGPDNTATVRLDQPQAAVTPGQAAVFYRGDEVLGGGWIVSGGKS